MQADSTPPEPRPRAGARAILAAAAAAFGACGDTGDAAVDPSLIHTVRRGDLVMSVRERGEISAASNTKVVSEVEGRATLIYLVPEGTLVKKGDRLAELDANEIVEKRTVEEIAVAKAEAALQQARKNVEIMERELRAAESTAESELQIAKLHATKLIGQPRTADVISDDPLAGTNAQVIEELRALVAEDAGANAAPAADSGEPATGDEPAALGVEALARAERARRPVSGDLVQKVLDLFETEAALGLQMGEMGNQILQEISKINLARADLEVAAEKLRYSEQLAAEGFMTRSELSRDRIDYQRRIAEMSLAWNNLDLLVNYTLEESKIAAAQEVSNAELGLASVRATAEARRVREASELASAESEHEVAKQRLATWNDQIEKAVLYAPSPGLVVYGRFDWDEPVYEGMEVRKRQEIVVLPDVTKMIAQLLVHEAQVDSIAPGQKATVQVDAFPDRVFTATVNSVSTLPDVRGSWRSDVKVYAVRVDIDGENTLGSLRPGMNSTIQIQIGTLEDVIAIPQPALERAKDRQYVWRVTSDGPVATPVTIGANNLTHVEIVSGLDVGDRIYLVPPQGAKLPEAEKASPKAGVAGDGQPVEPEPEPERAPEGPPISGGEPEEEADPAPEAEAASETAPAEIGSSAIGEAELGNASLGNAALGATGLAAEVATHAATGAAAETSEAQ